MEEATNHQHPSSPQPVTQMATICIISGDLFADKFMHACDVFEPFKRLAVPEVFDVEGLTDDAAQRFIDEFRQQFSTKRFIVAAFLVGTAIGYVDDSVKLISDGHTFCALADMLKTIGYRGAIQ